MAKLPKFTLSKNKGTQRWDLAQDKSHEVLKSFSTKDKATAGGALKKVLGAEGGSVKIKKLDGEFQEERTFPRSADPKSSKG